VRARLRGLRGLRGLRRLRGLRGQVQVLRVRDRVLRVLVKGVLVKGVLVVLVVRELRVLGVLVVLMVRELWVLWVRMVRVLVVRVLRLVGHLQRRARLPQPLLLPDPLLLLNLSPQLLCVAVLGCELALHVFLRVVHVQQSTALPAHGVFLLLSLLQLLLQTVFGDSPTGIMFPVLQGVLKVRHILLKSLHIQRHLLLKVDLRLFLLHAFPRNLVGRLPTH